MKIEPPGPEARKTVAIDTAVMATSTKCSPLVAESAKGSVVTDVDGNRYLDFATGIAVHNVGHCHPRVTAAVKDQVDRLMHFAGTDFYYRPQVDLARRLCELAPGDFEKKAFLSNSGTESVEAAVKLARWSTGRKRFIGFIGAFHGRTMGSLALTASKPVQRESFFPMMPGVTHIPYANCYRCPYRLEYPECDVWCAKVLDEVYFQSMLPPEEVAALFIEPIQGEGGYIVPPKEFMRTIKEIAHKYGILYVDDEVQAGMGRTGRMWGTEHHGVVPDILCTAKALGSGMPVAATVFNRLFDFGVEGAHSNTYGGNPVACASALATLDVLEEENLVAEAAGKGAYLRKRLNELMDRHQAIGDVRGLGLMQATEFVKDRSTKEYAVELRDRVVELCFKRGLILLPCGKSGIRYIPPLNVEDEYLDRAVEILDEAIGDASKELLR
ncbi:MAG: acetyl ornithine aminotransferase family protein [Methanomassiliicoccales archaeon]